MQVSLTYLLFAFLKTNIVTQAYDQSLKDCKAVAAEFRNTCAHGDYDTPAAIGLVGMNSETVVCENSNRCIAAGVKIGSACTWERKLCVTCRDDDGVTKVRVQSNNLPDHCVSPGNNLPKAKNFDYEVIFNKKQTRRDLVNNFATQEELNSAVCPIHKQYDGLSLGIVEYGDDESRNAAGFAINGVVFQFANQIEEDPASPITETNEQPMDLCLGHNQRNSPGGMYHYHHLTPCLNPNFLDGKTMSECTAHDDCNKDVSAWSRSGYENMKYKKIIGISKFGHVMYGPYKNSGKLWGTGDVDACNGAWSGNDYFYVGTAWHPYLVGCQGPSNHPQDNGIFAQCSTNGMDKYDTGSVRATDSKEMSLGKGNRENIHWNLGFYMIALAGGLSP
jgi:hypothetical protein